VPTLSHHTIQLPNWPQDMDGYRIAHLSDFHCRPSITFQDLADLVEQVDSVNANLVAMTGDFTDRTDPQTFARLGEFADGIAAPDGVIAVFGNHDHITGAAEVERALVSGGVEILEGRGRLASDNNSGVWVCGVGDLDQDIIDLDGALANAPPDCVVLLLAHHPDTRLVIEGRGVDVIFSGHTHGGQVCLPGGRAVVSNVLLPMGEITGLQWSNGTAQVMSRGIGWTGLPLRLWCPPEIPVVTFYRSRADDISV